MCETNCFGSISASLSLSLNLHFYQWLIISSPRSLLFTAIHHNNLFSLVVILLWWVGFTGMFGKGKEVKKLAVIPPDKQQ